MKQQRQKTTGGLGTHGGFAAGPKTGYADPFEAPNRQPSTEPVRNQMGGKIIGSYGQPKLHNSMIQDGNSSSVMM